MNENTNIRPAKNLLPEVRADAPHAALLIDFDNVTMGIRSDLQNQLRRLLDSDIIKGKVSVQRAYADWRRYPQYIVPLSEASIDLIFAPAFGANKKNATDIRLAIDALELVFTRPEIGTFILLSGDSDFSALVLKLKEYAKYVIGVGIRESSSDLLVQNCDEYFSYNELTGLAKEGEIEHVRRDPWELVVEAVQQMERDDDVMRSDRLKQVMQSIDPNFEEKDVGYNRFSKFVVGAADRGLLKLTRMENGQFAIEMGSNANVPPVDTSATIAEVTKPRTERPRKRPGAGARAARSSAAEALTLSEGFELLKQALLILGAVDNQWTDADRARAQMVELYGEESDPVFAARRFERLLRQARDANLIELNKQASGFALRLDPSALLDEAAPQEPTPTPAAPAVPAETAAVPSPRPRSRKASRPRRTRSTASPESRDAAVERDVESAAPKAPRPRRAPRAKRARTETPQATSRPERSSRSPRPPRTGRRESPRETRVPDAEPAVQEQENGGSKAESRQRNPRYRKGSRSAPARPSSPGAADEPAESTPASPVAGQTWSGPRSLGARKGSRKGRPPSRPAEAESASQGRARPDEAPKSSIDSTPEVPARAPERRHPVDRKETRPPVSGPQVSSGATETADQDSGGLLRRMSAAFQRAVRGKAAEGDESQQP